MRLANRPAACAVVAIVAVCQSVSFASQPTGTAEIGWLGLYNRTLVEWLENENQLQTLCAAFPESSATWEQCRTEKLAPRIHAVRLWSGPTEKAAAAGSLLVLATPGQGLRSFFVPVTGGPATAFVPDLFDGDWGYGPYFHQTFLERRATWFRLPAVPFAKGTWINASEFGEDREVRLLEVGQIVSSPFGDLVILAIEPGVVRARPEQDADMHCGSDTPALEPWREIRIPRRDLYTPTGHLVLHTKYTRGC